MLGYNHYFIMLPSSTDDHYLQRPAVLSSDSFLTWIYDECFDDDGFAKKMLPEDFQSVKSLSCSHEMLALPFHSMSKPLC
jgi:hypothetical protein